ncbi:AreB protein [Trichoderma harzianum]|uniref:AreB protein n=1 Tax=Trichoderma harzianum TaxID=5544 RepID=A0A0F9XY27_TRIHA|nr:AreB protein [Trichoderma harzianum]
MMIWHTETFAPIALLIPFSTVDEAVALANHTAYNLSASAYTANIPLAIEIERRLESGSVHINSMTIHDEAHMPHGGVKESGWGRFGGEGDPFTLCDVVLDEVQPNEVLVEVWYTGICHTDVVVQHGGMPLGGYPAVLGHEGAGVVRWTGSAFKDKSLKPGDSVLLSFHSCRQCRFCLEGRCGTCPHMTETNFVRPARRDAGADSPISLLDGTKVHGQFFGQSSMNKLAVVAEASVIKVDAKPEELRTLPPLGCGYLAAVVGVGAVGIAAMLAAKSLGVRQVIPIDVVEAKLKVASSLGATHIVNSATEPDLQTALHAIIPGGPNSIIDTTGLIGVLEASVKALAHGGTLALVGVPAPTATMRINALDLLQSCKRVIGVIEVAADPHILIPRLLELYRDGKFPVDCLAKVYPAEQLDKAITDLESGLIVKPILSWENLN